MSDHISILMDVDEVQHLKAHLSSFSRQSHRAWDLTLSSGAEGQDALKEANRLVKLLGLQEQVKLVPLPESATALERLHRLIQQSRGDYLLFFDQNHRLLSDKGLEEIISNHREGWEFVAGDVKHLDGLIRQRRLHPFESCRQQPAAFFGPFSVSKSLCRLPETLLQTSAGAWFEVATQQALGYALCERGTRVRFLGQPLFSYLEEVLPEPFNDEGLWVDARMPRPLAEEIHVLADRVSHRRVDQSFFQSHIYEYMEMSAQAERMMTRLDLINSGGLIGVATPPPENTQRSRDPETRTKILRISSLALGLDPKVELSDEQEELLAELSKIEEGELLAERGRFDEAREIFEALLPEMGESARLLTNLGVIYWVREESQRGMQCFVKAMKLDRDLRDPVMNFAGGMVELGHLSQALAVTRDFSRRHPDDEPVRELLKELEKIERAQG